MADKYEQFKQATFDLLEGVGRSEDLATLQAVAKALDGVEDEPQTQQLTLDDFNNMNYQERVQLKRDNPQLYASLIGGGSL